MKGSERVRQVNQRFRNETIIRSLIAVIGVLCFNFSSSFGWGFILGGVISKEAIDLRTKQGWGLLALVVGAMLIVIYLMLETPAIYGYLASTVTYFIMRGLFNHFQK